MKHIFFVISYGSIYRRVLPLIDSLKDEDILVVTPNENIYKFFFNYTNFPVIQINVNPNLVTKSTWYKAISNAIKSKIEYQKLFGNITEANIYFFGTGSSIVLFSYIQKLHKQCAGNVRFYSSEPDKLNKQIKPTILTNWKTKIVCKIVKILLGIQVEVRRDCGAYNLCVYEDYFKQNNIRQFYKEFDPSIYKKYMKDLDLKGKKVLILISDLVAEGRMESFTLEKQMNEFIYYLKKSYPDQYIVKPHPNLNKLYGAMKSAPQIDSYIPSQFIMNHPWEVVIADCSASLVFPEEQNLQNVKLIELVDLLQFKDKKVQKELKNFLVKWNPNLIFPQSFDELEVMLK